MHDRTQFDVTVRQILVRDRETNEEKTAWQVESENMDRPCRADTPEEALRLFADSFESDDANIRAIPEELAAD
jgi:hypothetical protein